MAYFLFYLVLEVFGKNNNDVRFFAIPDFGFWPKRCSGKIKDIEFVDERKIEFVEL